VGCKASRPCKTNCKASGLVARRVPLSPPQGERALQVFEELRSTPGLIPDLRSYNLAMKGCESPPTRVLRPQQLEQALALKEELLARGLVPDRITYGTLIHLCAQVGCDTAGYRQGCCMWAVTRVLGPSPGKWCDGRPLAP